MNSDQTRFYYCDNNAPKPNRPNHLGVVVLICHDDSVLMEYRADSDYWTFIGGGLEIDETLAQGALREVREETGIVLSEQDLSFYKIYDDPSRIIAYPDGNILRSITIVFMARLADIPGMTISKESRELRFMKIQDLSSLPVAPTHIPIIEDICKNKV